MSAATRAAMPPGGLPNPKEFPDLSKLACINIGNPYTRSQQTTWVRKS
ncbi:hypothetical protein ACN23B_23440 [Anabaena sp. FACHB-709]|uniref:Uncharacterized protein n=1 Tax=Anabaena cylindrica FACHB-318 TaxID=2692880 RepID=A0ABR7ZLD6_ANACY|nr:MULTISPECIES: hypothetical protein [Nostocaceae]MBD2173449.1 hypothetical protein [Anabaena cylindrica FACHB-318]MBD2265242.1 hypothetical protein [Anabaena sp. FACHB-709]MBD2274510.1 hypothetical protein [Nostoc sp. PCC 7120 = FACHB-418]MBD2285441.1 hypothetical protein [Anabaena cylindrica FACHB-170]MBD2350934.1 hypothetical protein [Trichormus variabilis FACHB-171]